MEEGRVGGGIREYTDKIRSKISESLKKHYEQKGHNVINIEKHRNSMAKAVGVRVYQYNKDNTLVTSYESISEAARAMNCLKGNIQQALNKSTRTAKGYIWKTTGPNTIEHT